MKRLKLSLWFAVVALAITLAPRAASAQAADTLSLSSVFHMDDRVGSVGADLAGVFSRGNDHEWSLTLYGVTYSYSYVSLYDELGYEYGALLATRVHALAFDLQFFGPDADVLNDVVSAQLIRGSLGEGACLELRNVYFFDFVSGYATWDLGFLPLDPASGVAFHAWNTYHSPFAADGTGYPVVAPQLVSAERTQIVDLRPGSAGALMSFFDDVEIGAAEPPLPPMLNIEDGKVLEGNRGTSRLPLKVTLSRISNDLITVKYRTVNGSALASKDYSAVTNGALSFQPGQTSRTISISITTDGKREPNETFSVQLSSAVGATIGDAVGTATILNDD